MKFSKTTSLALACAFAFAACDKSETKAESQKVEPAVELSPQQKIALYQAEFNVVNALASASTQALREADRMEESEPVPMPADLVKPDTKTLTVFFGGNNHGEREDCGCRKNPLGGLGRRHTLMADLADGSVDANLWGTLKPAQPIFHVDAGDGFYPHATLKKGTPNAQKIARHDARAVVDALNTFPPDAFLVGELDLAFGTEDIQELSKAAKFPFVSANLRSKGGELLFPSHVVVERDGVKLGVVGVTKQKTRFGNYYEEAGLEVTDPTTAAAEAIAALPKDVGSVVLLSNLGMNDTISLVEALKGSGKRVDFVVVSGTNRLTHEPEWAAGTPLVEPLSRGKYVGAATLYLNGDDVDYRNATGSAKADAREYRLALRSYHTTRKQLVRDLQKLEELKMTLEDVQARAEDPSVKDDPKKQPAAEILSERREEAIKEREKRIETVEKRLETVSQNLLSAVGKVSNEAAPVTGDDWVDAAVVPVKIEIDEVGSTRRVLDRAEKRRPKPEPVRRPNVPTRKAE